MADGNRCKIIRNDEAFTVEVQEDSKKTTVTDEKGTVVTISPSSGNFDVRLPNGWGRWVPTIEEAVNRAVGLCIEYRSQLAPEKAYEEMIAYVKNCK